TSLLETLHGRLPGRVKPVDVLFKMAIIDMYIVHLGNSAFDELTHILDMCILRERESCDKDEQDSGPTHRIFTPSRVTLRTHAPSIKTVVMDLLAGRAWFACLGVSENTHPQK